jgi:hypothetical protein
MVEIQGHVRCSEASTAFKKKKKQHFIFWSTFGFTAKLRRKYRDFSCSSCSHMSITVPAIKIPYQRVTFVITDEST